jgi:MFS family permease
LAAERSPVPGVSRNVFVLGLVSFAADVSSEMLYPVLPVFLTITLGVPVSLVGVIEGVAEGTAGTSKVAAGWWSDRLPRRRPLVAGGYALSALGKLLLAVAFVWPQALLARFCDRLGKGTRTAPRDALIADSSVEGGRGRVFGFHRGLDTAGAVVGPLLGLGLVASLGEERLRLVFALAVLPALVSIALVWLARERARTVAPRRKERLRIDFSGAPAAYWLFLGVSFLFAFGNSSDAFLLLRARDLGLGLTAVILAYVVYNIAYALLSFPAGIVADRLGPRPVLVGGFLVFGLVYLGFAAASGGGAVWPLFAAYGLTMALTEGVGRALISDLAPADRRGAFLGLYHTTIGLTAVVASVLAGVLWDQVAPAAPFALGAATGLAAAALLAFTPRRPPVLAEARA